MHRRAGRLAARTWRSTPTVAWWSSLRVGTMLSVMLGRTSRTATGGKCLVLGWGSVLAYELFKLLTPTA